MESEKKRRFFSSSEVAKHDLSSDCWVSYFGKVFDLTPLIKENPGPLTEPICKFAGKDISDWFDSETNQPKTCIDRDTGVRVPYLGNGKYLHLPPNEPLSNWRTDFTPWWEDEKYFIGFLSKRKRMLRIINMLTSVEDLVEICCEETLEEVRERYTDFNKHAESYTFKHLGRPLNLKKTLDENGIPDDEEEMRSLKLEDPFIPSIQVYFNDDLSIA